MGRLFMRSPGYVKNKVFRLACSMWWHPTREAGAGVDVDAVGIRRLDFSDGSSGTIDQIPDHYL